MSRQIESLENRVLLSVTPAQLHADAQALVKATSSSNAAFNAVRSAEFGLIKAVTRNVKHNGGLIGNVVGGALTAALSVAGQSGYAHIKSSQKALTSAAKSTALRSVSQGKALLKDANNSTVQSGVQDLINQLEATLPADLSSLQTVLQDAGTLIENAFAAIIAAVPGLSSAVQSVAQTVLQKSQDFDTALAAIPTAAAQLAADLSSIAAAQGTAVVTHAYVGPAPAK